MKLRLSFDVKSNMRLDDHWPIAVNGVLYEFVVNQQNLVEGIVATIPSVHPDEMPTITQTDDGATPQINIPIIRHYPFISHDLKVFQGIACPHGSIEIDVTRPEYEWIPESEEEKEKLKLYRFKSNQEPMNPRIGASFDVIARALIVSGRLPEYEVPLSFFRRGVQDYHNDDYRLAFYNYYFFLESMYGEGKFKERDLTKIFGQNAELMKAVSKARDETINMRMVERNAFYKMLSETNDPQIILKKTILRRGESHHHSTKNPKAWHPDKQDDFLTESVFLHLVCMDMIHGLEGQLLFSEEIENAFIKTSIENGAEKTAYIQSVLIEDGQQKQYNIKSQILSMKLGQSRLYSTAHHFVDHVRKVKPNASIHSFRIMVDKRTLFTDKDFAEIERMIESV